MSSFLACVLTVGIVALLPFVAAASQDATVESDSIFVFSADDYALFPDANRILFRGNDDLLLEAQVAPDVRAFSNLYEAVQKVFTVAAGDDCPADNQRPEQ